MKRDMYMSATANARAGALPRFVIFAALLVAVALAPAVASAAADGQDSVRTTPYKKFIRGGVEFAHYTNDYGNGDNEFVTAWFAKEYDYWLQFDLGRSARFGDEGIGVGASFTNYLPDGWSYSVGASTGSGDHIFPRYRLDAAVARAFLPQDNLTLRLGYVHEQSKGDNYYDRAAIGAEWWLGTHWILAGHFNYDMGQPGNTTTMSGGFGLTYYEWVNRYIGASVEYGDVNYTQVGLIDYLVDYEEIFVKLYYTEYFSPTFGVDIRLDWGHNEFYEVYGVSFRVFKEW